MAITGAPTFDESVKKVLAPVASDGSVDGLLLANVSTDDLTIVITIPPTAEYPLKPTDTLYLLLDTTDYRQGDLIRVMDQTTDVPDCISEGEGQRMNALSPECSRKLSIQNFETGKVERSEEHTYELQSQLTISYAVFSLKKKDIKLSISILSTPTERWPLCGRESQC